MIAQSRQTTRCAAHPILNYFFPGKLLDGKGLQTIEPSPPSIFSFYLFNFLLDRRRRLLHPVRLYVEGIAVAPEGDKVKVELAERLRAETTMSLRWLAQELGMGSWTYVSNLLSKRRNKK